MCKTEDILRAVERANELVEQPRCQLPSQRVREAISARIVSPASVIVANPPEVLVGKRRLETVQLRLYRDGLWWVGLVKARGKYKEQLCGYGPGMMRNYAAVRDDVEVGRVRAFDVEHARLLLGLNGVKILETGARQDDEVRKPIAV
jgi:hypothetical protein